LTGHGRIVGPQYETYFVSPYWFTEFEDCPCIFGKIVDPWSTTSLNNMEVHTCHLQLMSKHSWRRYRTHRTNVCLSVLSRAWSCLTQVVWR